MPRGNRGRACRCARLALRVLTVMGIAALTLYFVPTRVPAQTPRIQGQGTAASGQGNAFTAQADDPSAVHYNPAGLTQLTGVQIMGGALWVGGTTGFTSPTGLAVRGDRGGNVARPRQRTHM